MLGEIVEGWAVVRLTPWDFHGPFPDRAVALKLSETLNSVPRPEYDVKWGMKPRKDLRESELKFWKAAGK